MENVYEIMMAENDKNRANEAFEAKLQSKKYEVREECGGSDILTLAAGEDIEARLNDWVGEGDYGDRSETVWVRAWYQELDADGDPVGDEVRITVTLEADVPECSPLDASDECEHDWQSPLRVVGGIKENPGVYGHGGGVIITEVCCHCGTYRETDTWAQNSETGEQGLTSVKYRDADDLSREWIESQSEKCNPFGLTDKQYRTILDQGGDSLVPWLRSR